MLARYAVVDPNGNIVNVVSYDREQDFWSPPPGHSAVPSETANIGGTFIDGVYTPPPPLPVPPEIQSRQARWNAFDTDADFREFADTLVAATPVTLKSFMDKNLPSLTPPERLILAKILFVIARNLY